MQYFNKSEQPFSFFDTLLSLSESDEKRDSSLEWSPKYSNWIWESFCFIFEIRWNRHTTWKERVKWGRIIPWRRLPKSSQRSQHGALKLRLQGFQCVCPHLYPSLILKKFTIKLSSKLVNFVQISNRWIISSNSKFISFIKSNNWLKNAKWDDRFKKWCSGLILNESYVLCHNWLFEIECNQQLRIKQWLIQCPIHSNLSSNYCRAGEVPSM